MARVRVMIKFPQAEPYAIDMDNNLKVAQEIIGGFVEYAHIPATSLALLVDNEQCFKDTKPNILYGEQIIKGPIIAIKCGERNTMLDLDDNDIKNVERLLKYSALTEDCKWMYDLD